MLVKEKLPFYIRRWIEEGENRSLSSLARHSGVAYPTLRRIASGECEPTVNNLLAVCEIVTSRAELTELLTHVAPSISKYYKEIKVADSKNPDLKTKPFLEMEEYHIPLLLSGRAKGCTREEVAQYCGEIGIVALDEMIEAEVVVKKDDKYVLQDELLILQSKTIKQFVTSLLKVYNPNVDANPVSTIGFCFENFNMETVRELNHDIDHLRSKILRYMEDPARKGDVTWFSGLFANTFGAVKQPNNLT